MADLNFSQGSDPVCIFNDSNGNQMQVETLGNVFMSNVARLFTINNKMYGISLELNAASGSTDNPQILLKNPSGSGKTFYIFTANASLRINNVFADYAIFIDPTVTANGTTQTPVSLNIGGGAPSSAANLFSLPTVSANGTRIVTKVFSQNGTDVSLARDGVIALGANHSLLITASPASNNRVSAYTLYWAEV